MTADPYTRLDAAYLLGALDADGGPAARSPSPEYADLRSRRNETGLASQGRWLVSLTQCTAANPRPCHLISLMQAEPRYSR